ncbi:MAG: SDR family oxidoreductase, partial [Bacteroidia bacterium]|nr:SDR family oxidoreductase [Bacteroidia bacterium]
AGYLVNKPFAEISQTDLSKIYSVNVFGPFHLVQSLLPLMGKNQKAHIVNIGSMGGVQGTSKFPGLSAYTSSKMALAGLSECLAEELKEKNISVNCLAIGAVQTEMMEEAFPGYKPPHTAAEMASFIGDFAINGHKFFNGKIVPVAVSVP